MIESIVFILLFVLILYSVQHTIALIMENLFEEMIGKIREDDIKMKSQKIKKVINDVGLDFSKFIPSFVELKRSCDFLYKELANEVCKQKKEIRVRYIETSINDNYIELLKFLLRKEHSELFENYMNTWICLAAQYVNVEILKYLLKIFPQFIFDPIENYQHKNIFEWLIKKKLEYDGEDVVDNRDFTRTANMETTYYQNDYKIILDCLQLRIKKKV